MNTASFITSPGTSPVVEAREWSASCFEKQFLNRILGLAPILERYRRLPLTANPAEFALHALEALAVRVQTQGEPLEKLPASGPLLLAANHPFGALEGLILAALCATIRPDLKILANHILCRIPEFQKLIIPVDVLGSNKGDAGNVSGLRAALRHLESGGALALFPAGVVSHWHARHHCVTDPEWNPLIGRLARVPETAVMPLYFAGRNSLLFQAAGYMHSLLRTMLLPRELWRMRGRDVQLCVGKVLEQDVLSALADDAGRTAYIRARCYALGRRHSPDAKAWPVAVAEPEDREALRSEIKTLGPQILVEEKNFQVFPVQGGDAPHILHEIGRLREKTFRAAREGSGKALDSDRFDPHYTHLVLWDKDAERITGSYRVRVFLPEHAREAEKKLYTASLFRFKPGFFGLCGLSMELGRAFVTKEYQRDYAPLLLLWKGIARLARNSGVNTLFGACSIGLDYMSESRLMLRRCLKERHFAPELACLVKGRRSPALFSGPNEPHARGLEYKLLNRAVKGLEGGKSLPVLFKHYLQLGGRIAAFHEDGAFGTLDALMVVDLATVPAKVLSRYTGGECSPGLTPEYALPSAVCL